MNEPTLTCMLIICACILAFIGMVLLLFKEINDEVEKNRQEYIEKRRKEHEAWLAIFDKPKELG